MSSDRDTTRIVRSWLDESVTQLPDRVLDAVLDQVPATPQRRAWWPARRLPVMNNFARIAIAAVAVIAVAVFGYSLLRGSNSVGPAVATPTPTPIPTPTVSESTLPASFFTSTPFAPGGFGMCPPASVSSDCTEDPRDDSMTFTFEAPEGWEGLPGPGGSVSGVSPLPEGYESPAGAAMIIHRGNWLYSDPCRPDDDLNPDIPVGPTVDDFATALDSHPALEVTTPVDVTLAGYSGKYTELQVPADISGCVRYRPLEGTIYAQGPSNRWRFWILDVEGIRVVIQTQDFPGTSAQRKAELQAIVDSIQIQP
jgi:hypothetical protein